MRLWIILALACALTLPLAAQQGPSTQPDSKVTLPKKNPAPPRSDDQRSTAPSHESGGYSSSKDTMIDLSPPAGEKHPPRDSEEASDVNELKPWNPHRASKNIEVGDYYFKRKNYAAAESRYREALAYKPNDALGSFRLGQVLDKTGRGDEALPYYAAYLKVLPQGAFAEECHKAITRLSGKTAKK
jgi:tetratricopeptide (TPR) repeat protein